MAARVKAAPMASTAVEASADLLTMGACVPVR